MHISVPTAVLALIRWYLPRSASAHGPSLDSDLLLNLWIAAALLAALHIFLFLGILLRRRSETHKTNLVETIPVALFAVLLIVLTVRSERLWAASRYVGPDPAALQVEVTGMQFAWYFHYPGADYAFGRTHAELIAPGAGNPIGLDRTDPHADDDFVISELVLPAGREVDLHLHAQDVIHGFAIPAMRLKQNAIPGQEIHVHFTPVTPGTYAILCTQLCGMGHYRMAANLRVLPPDRFAVWLARKQAAAQ